MKKNNDTRIKGIFPCDTLNMHLYFCELIKFIDQIRILFTNIFLQFYNCFISLR